MACTSRLKTTLRGLQPMYVEILRVRRDEIKTAHQDGIREMLRSGLQFQAESNKYWKSCRSN